MAVQIGKAVGAWVICVVDLTGDGEGGKRRMLKGLGADVVVDGGEGWEDRVKKVTQCEEGVDVVYDCIGAVESGIRCLRYRGRLVVVGFAARGGKMEKVMVNRILLKGITVVGYVSLPL
jgi:NADPH:quinone reductase-like Zn-dependent oxidoreductase